MKQRLFRLSFITASVAAKIVFGLVLSVVILTKVDARLSAEAFQALLLQTAFITITSGSAYPRAVAANGDAGIAAGLTRAFVLISAVIAAAVLLSSVAGSHRPGWPSFARADVVALLLLGGFATGLHTLFQGLFLAQQGEARTFLPSTLALSLAAIAILAVDVRSLLDLVVVIALTQCASLLFYVVWNSRAVAGIGLLKKDTTSNPVRAFVSETLAFGLTATIYLLVLLAVRESWRGSVEAAVAAHVFFAMRLSDVYMQVAFYVFSSSNRINVAEARVSVGKHSLSRPAIVAAFALLLILTFGGVGLVFANLQLLGLAVASVGAQLVVDVIRVPASVFGISLVKAARPSAYAAIVLPSLAVLVIAWLATRHVFPAASLFVMQAAYAFAIVGFWALLVGIVRGNVHTRQE